MTPNGWSDLSKLTIKDVKRMTEEEWRLLVLTNIGKVSSDVKAHRRAHTYFTGLTIGLATLAATIVGLAVQVV